MIDNHRSEVSIRDVWDALPEELRAEFLARRAASTGWGSYPRQESALPRTRHRRSSFVRARIRARTAPESRCCPPTSAQTRSQLPLNPPARPIPGSTEDQICST
jgi:hypothetical protein